MRPGLNNSDCERLTKGRQHCNPSRRKTSPPPPHVPRYPLLSHTGTVELEETIFYQDRPSQQSSSAGRGRWASAASSADQADSSRFSSPSLFPHFFVHVQCSMCNGELKPLAGFIHTSFSQMTAIVLET